MLDTYNNNQQDNEAIYNLLHKQHTNQEKHENQSIKEKCLSIMANLLFEGHEHNPQGISQNITFNINNIRQNIAAQQHAIIVKDILYGSVFASTAASLCLSGGYTLIPVTCCTGLSALYCANGISTLRNTDQYSNTSSTYLSTNNTILDNANRLFDIIHNSRKPILNTITFSPDDIVGIMRQYYTYLKSLPDDALQQHYDHITTNDKNANNTTHVTNLHDARSNTSIDSP